MGKWKPTHPMAGVRLEPAVVNKDRVLNAFREVEEKDRRKGLWEVTKGYLVAFGNYLKRIFEKAKNIYIRR